MNKSVCENCIPKCIVVFLGKNPEKVDFFQAKVHDLYQATNMLMACSSPNYSSSYFNVALCISIKHQHVCLTMKLSSYRL